MEEKVVDVEMDEQGRIVIPAHIRKQIGTDRFTLHATPGELILRRSDDNDEELDEWRERIKNTAPKPRPSGDKDKWVSEAYGRRKLGL